AILAVLVILLSSTNPLFQKTTEVYSYFDDSFAMVAGATPVRLNGIQVGKVRKIELSNSQDLARTIRVTMAINDEFLQEIPVDSKAGMAQQNLLGTRYINIKKGKSKNTIQARSEISTIDSPELEDLFQQGTTTLGALQSILKRVETIVALIENG